MIAPNFFIIGAAKSASSSLYYYLRQHPDVFMCEPKEPHFFAFEGGVPAFRDPTDEPGPWDGPRASPARFRRAHYSEAIIRPRDYERLFAAVRNERAVGEASVLYFYFPPAARRIREVAPEAKLIAILRQPVDRGFSHFLQARKEGREPLADFADAVAAEPRRIQRGWAPVYHYMARGYYFEQLSVWLACFPREQFHFLLYDDLAADPVAATRSVYRFLGVDDSFTPDTRRRLMDYTSPTDVPRTRLGHWLLNRPNALKSIFNRLVPSKALRQPLRRLLLALNRKGTREWTKPVLPADLRRELTARFQADIEQLQTLLGRDLRHWMP